jgi:hypothetical protein
MKFSVDNINWSSPEAYNAQKSWVLTAGEGTKKVYARFSDKAGNWSDSFFDTIILDTTAPHIDSITPADSAALYENSTVVISVAAGNTGPSLVEYQFSIDGVILQAWSGQSTYSWSTTAGKHTLKVEVKDTGGEDSRQSEVFVLRRPIAPPS